MPPTFRTVPALSPGAHVRIVAPSSPFGREDFDRGVARLRERYRVSYDDRLFETNGFLAGDDARRADELRAALDDESVDAIVAARGGYGATRLLPELELERVREANKLLVGFSDITALHALWARAGLRSIHGPMVAALGRAELAWVERWIAAVEGAPFATASGLETIARGRGAVEGPLVGGNLAVLAALAGTPYAPPLEGAILFLEDVGEAPYRVDRMLTTLRQAGWLEQVAGVALGFFTDCHPRPDGRTVTEVLSDRLSDLPVPVIAGLGAGHEPDNQEIPLGAEVRLDPARGTLAFLEHAVRVSPAGTPGKSA